MSKPGERTFGSRVLLWASAAIVLTGCGVLAPLEEVDQRTAPGEQSTQDNSTEARDSAGDGASSPPAKKKDGGGADSGGDDDGAAIDDDRTPPGEGSSRAGRSGGTRPQAGTGGRSTTDSSAGGAGATDAGATDASAATDAAAGGAVDAGTPTNTSNGPACDPVNPRQPRPPLMACAAGQACVLHEDAPRASNGAVPTSCETAGSAAPGASCTQDADCTAGHICDSALQLCLQLCGTTQDCDDGICPSVALRTIGTTALPIGICLL